MRPGLSSLANIISANGGSFIASGPFWAYAEEYLSVSRIASVIMEQRNLCFKRVTFRLVPQFVGVLVSSKGKDSPITDKGRRGVAG